MTHNSRLSPGRVLLGAVVSLSALGSGLAHAQDSARAQAQAETATAAADADAAGAEIVVTAQKRSESLQRVAAAVTALGSERVESLGVTNLDQIGNLAPGISVVPVRSQAFIFIRGVGQTLTTPNADAAVATNFNGVYLPAEIAGTAFFDVGRIEVLPGPQGTLYGRNSTGGVINISSRMPGDAFGVNGFVEIGNYDRRQAVLGVDLPITSNLLSRTAGTIVRHDGYTSNGLDDQRNAAIRQTLVWAPGDSTTVTGVATYTHDGGIGNVWQNVPPADCGNRCASFDPKALGYYNDTDTFQGSLQVEQRLGDALTLTYIGGYSHLDMSVKNSLWIGPPLAPLQVDEKIDIQTHELRLNAELDRFNGIAGFYYFDQDTIYRNDIRPSATVHRASPFDTASHGWAAFGQGTYEISSGVRATGGLRFSRTVKSIDGANNSFNTSDVLTSSRPFVGRTDLNRLDWKIGLEADVGADSMAYANVSTGFTPGGFSTEQAVPGQPAASPFKPVKLRAYVAGIKNRLAGGRLTLNLEGYYYDYKNYQVSARDAATGRNLVFNAEKATIYGGQFDARFRPSRHDDIMFTANYLHAKADRLLTPVGRFDGYDLPYSPKWTLNAYYQRSFDVGSDGAQLRGDINFKYSSSRWAIYSHGAGFDIEANTHTDVTFGYFAPDDRWYVQAFVRNLEDDLVKTSCGAASPGPAGCFFEAPRTYGGRIGFKL